MKNKRYITIGVSIIALIISLFAICIAAYRAAELSFDYQGVIVGMLALLVTALIGWQIYTLVDLRGLKNEVEKNIIVLDKEKQRLFTSTSLSLMDFYYAINVNQPIKEKQFKYIHYSILSIYHSSKMDDYETCNAIVKGLLESIPNPEEIRLSKRNKDLIFNVVTSWHKPSNISQHQEVLVVLSNIAVSD